MNLIEYYFEYQNPKFITLEAVSDLATKVQLRFKLSDGSTEILTFQDIILAEYLGIPIHSKNSRTELMADIHKAFVAKRADSLPFGDNSWELEMPIPLEWNSAAQSMVDVMSTTKTLTSFTLDTALATSSRIAYQYVLITLVVTELVKQKQTVNAILQAVKADKKVLLRRDIFNEELLMEVEESEDE